MYNDLLNLNNIEKIDNFFPRYLIKPIQAFKYNQKIFHSIDYDPPRYCDLNITYITSNFYSFQKLRNMYNVKFLPYNRVMEIDFSEKFKIIKKSYKNEATFLTGDTFSLAEKKVLEKNSIVNRINTAEKLYSKFCNKININFILNNCIPIFDIIFCIIISNYTILNNKIFIDTIDDFNIKELCHWLNCVIKNKNEINSKNIVSKNINKLLTLNNLYIYDYILNDNKNIPFNMSYEEFLKSDLW